MIPTDSGFSILYFVYGIVLILILGGLIFAENKKAFWLHIVFYSLYTGLMVYIFSDKENFSGGGSLGVLFYGFVFPFSHVIIYGIIKLIKTLRKTLRRKMV